MHERLAAVPTRYRVVVDVRAPVADVEQQVSTWGTVQPTGPASCRLTMNVDTLDWPALMLGAIAADFDVVEPAELRGYLRDMGERFLRSA